MLNCLFSLINKYTPHSYSNHTLSFGVDLTISLNSRTSGEPYFSYTIAFIIISLNFLGFVIMFQSYDDIVLGNRFFYLFELKNVRWSLFCVYNCFHGFLQSYFDRARLGDIFQSSPIYDVTSTLSCVGHFHAYTTISKRSKASTIEPNI